MKRTATVAAVLTATWFLASHVTPSSGVAADETKPTKAPAPFVHTVIFTLKKDAPEGAADGMIRDASDLLAKIPTVREIRCGKPAEPAAGKSGPAKPTYDVGLLVLFDDAAGLKTYIDHPKHQEYVAKHLKNVELDKVHVYDFVEAKR